MGERESDGEGRGKGESTDTQSENKIRETNTVRSSTLLNRVTRKAVMNQRK